MNEYPWLVLLKTETVKIASGDGTVKFSGEIHSAMLSFAKSMQDGEGYRTRIVELEHELNELKKR